MLDRFVRFWPYLFTTEKFILVQLFCKFCNVMAHSVSRFFFFLQAACYGCGVMAQYGGEEYISACAGLLFYCFTGMIRFSARGAYLLLAPQGRALI